MSKAYDEIMDRIVVNDDMRRRVLQNVEKQMVDGAGTGENQTKNAGMKRQPAENDTKPANNVELQEDFAVWGEEEKRLRRMRRYRISKFLSAVACLALLITGVVVLPQINRGQQEPTSDQKMVGMDRFEGKKVIRVDINICIKAPEAVLKKCVAAVSK